MTLKAGNPYLMPEKVHSLEAGYQWKNGGTIILGSLYYRYVTDKLTTVTRYVDNNVLLTTTENLDNSMAAGAEVIVDAEVGKWLTFNFSGNLFYNRIDASRLGYGKRMDALTWSASLNAGIVPFRNFLLQLNSRNLSPELMPQGRREGTFTADIGVKYEIPPSTCRSRPPFPMCSTLPGLSILSTRSSYGSGWSSALTPGCCILACSGISVRPAVVSDVRERPSGFLQNSYRILLYLYAVTITLHRIWK